ncbi:amino acid adenylation domain-containing protein [Krasilnikovia cinnamomea]|uniref:Amino acid adenylation domain-containing protein n=1 Tax=Krasilnikovia cinnamomea TaxID=349313 RepID=A0A4Q7ZL28_9ACTN|nr:non-ribosomal peptide synthetase [Krasilnikovia cinnamomea]RZU51658.1 amino acid adenylation domain-containing protein [Krasilnikovia cinnamomea]
MTRQDGFAGAEAVLSGPTVERHVPDGVPGLIAAWAKRTADSVALVDSAGTVTYRQLDEASDAVAHALRSRGGRPGDVVAVSVPRGRHLVFALLGALKAGLPYLPLSQEDPPARSAAVVAQSGARLALIMSGDGGPSDADRVPGCDVLDVRAVVAAAGTQKWELAAYGDDHPAYVLFTSGSSGAPKGAVVGSLALANRLLWMSEQYRFGPADRILQKTPVTFDVSGWELWAPLTAGAQLILPPPGAHHDPGELIEWIVTRQVTVCHFVPSMLDEFLRWPQVGRCTSLRAVMCSGEALTPDHLRRFRRELPHAELHNLYGPTEAAIDVTYWPCPDHDVDTVLIGRPIDNCTLVVLDDDLQPVPAGEPGQLAIGGMPLAAGYLNRPDLTAASFIRSPGWCPTPRLYLTGDLVRRVGDDLEYLGRIDDQVKIRGNRVEPAEVDDALGTHPEVGAVTTVAVTTSAGTELAAFVVPPGTVPDPAPQEATPELTERLRSWVRARLPEPYVPRFVFTTGRLPVTSSGKRARRELTEQAERLLRADSDDAATGPHDDEPRALWSAALGHPVTDESRSFVADGGHSLAAVRLAGGVFARWGVRVPVRALLWEGLSLAGLRRLLPAVPVAETRPVPRRADRSRAPASTQQRSLWLWTRLFPTSPAYNVVGVLDIAGVLDVDAVRRADAVLTRRFEVLRTTFDEEPSGSMTQRIHPAAASAVRVEQHDRSQPWSTALERFATDLAGQVLPADRLPRHRAGVLVGDDRSGLVLVVDHLVADQRSLDILLRELADAYATEADQRPTDTPADRRAEPANFGDLVVRRLHAPADPRRARDLEYWQNTLADAPDRLELPFRRPRPAEPSFRGASVDVDLDPPTRDALDQACRALGVTPATAVLAAFARVLAGWSGTDDLVVGVPMAGRETPEEIDAVGFFVTTLPVRLRVRDHGVPELIRTVADALTTAMDHGSVPFDDIVAALGRNRDLTTNPVFQVWCNDLTQAEPPARFGTHPATTVAVDASWSLFDLGLYLHAAPGGGYQVRLVYATDLWDAEVATEFLGQCVDRLLEVTAPAGSAEPDSRGAGGAAPTATCTDLVRRVLGHARRTPERTALAHGPERITYGELAGRVLAASARLRAGAPTGTLVPVRARRGPEFVAALLGCWHAGRPPLLVPDDAPAAWTDEVLAAAGVVPVPDLESDLPDGSAGDAEPVPMAADSPGHALATSGTSGTPAVVLLPANALPATLDEYVALLGLGAEDVFCWTTPPAHDPVFRDLVLPLTLGATVHVPAAPGSGPDALAAALADSGATILHATPSQLAMLSAARVRLPRLRHIVSHGEVLRETIARSAVALAPGATVWNLYGATETPQASGLHRYREPDADLWAAHRTGVPVTGVDLAYRTTWVARPDGSPARVGEVGELVVDGHGLALRYLGEAGREAPQDATDGSSVRCYRTGDVARRAPDGTVEVLGRRDRQLSVHGHRVEPAAIEWALAGMPEVAASVAVPDPGAGDAVVAVVVPAGPTVTDTELSARLRERLPGWQLPARIVLVPRLPLTPRGKVDHRALRDVLALSGRATTPSASTAEVCELIADRARAFAAQPLAEDTSFFAAGLTSLSLLQLHRRLTETDGLPLSLPELFRFPTARALAEHLTTGERPRYRRGPVIRSTADQTQARRLARARFNDHARAAARKDPRP